MIKIKIVQKYKEIKKDFAQCVILIKSGIFYEAIDDNAYIISYIFDYKIQKTSNFAMAGFPEKVIENVKERLIKEKISFVIIDGGKEFISSKKSFADTNYEVLLDISRKSYDIQIEVEKINRALEALKGTKNIEDIIRKIKEIL